MQFLKKREIRIIEREKKLDEKRKIDQGTCIYSDQNDPCDLKSVDTIIILLLPSVR